MAAVAPNSLRDTLIFDTGQSIVGIRSVRLGEYKAYYGDERRIGVQRLIRANEIVSYNGNRKDLDDISAILGLAPGQLPKFKGVHVDMRSVCWSDRILGSDLRSTYLKHFDSFPEFPTTYEGDNERDVYMTWRLWERWKNGTLQVIDGHGVANEG